MGFLAALEFLTRLRVRRTPAGDMRRVAGAQAWFPVVGLLIGALLLAIDHVASRALPVASVDVLLVVALVAVTGGLHLDGLADAADGLFGGRDRQQRLEIMRDVHAGTFAIVVIVSVMALKWAGLDALPRNVRYEALLLAPCLARLAMVIAAAAFPYARSEGVGMAFHDAARPLVLALACGVGTVASVAMLGAGGLALVGFAAASALAIGTYARRSVGGMTGDLYGATAELTEAGLFLLVAALATRGWLHPLLFDR
jgi:adenosylcobinamide-GDP ribazoletransferase